MTHRDFCTGSHIGCIHTRAKAKATSLPICCIVFNLCLYYIDSSSDKDQRKNRFRFRSSINEALQQVRLWREQRNLFASESLTSMLKKFSYFKDSWCRCKALFTFNVCVCVCVKQNGFLATNDGCLTEKIKEKLKRNR